MRALKERELRQLSTCIVCKEKIGQKPVPILWKVSAERHFLRHSGFTMMMGGNAAIASAMGADEDMTNPIDSTEAMICDVCMIERLPELLEGPSVSRFEEENQ